MASTRWPARASAPMRAMAPPRPIGRPRSPPRPDHRWLLTRPRRAATANPDLLAPSVAGNVVFDVNTGGMSHVGMYPDWLQDVSNTLTTVGAPSYMVPIFRSAESFVRLWEQIDGTRPRGGDALTDDF